MLPPEALEAVLRLGVVGPGDHAQVQIEVRDAATNELLALWADPHKPLADLDAQVARAAAELVKIVRELTGPF